jgi:hypothetical protein
MAAEGFLATSPTAAVSPSAASNLGMPRSSMAPPPPPPPPPPNINRPQFCRPDQLQVQQPPQPPDPDRSDRRVWMPKMEFPRFDGDGVRMWLDNCASYFIMYNIPENFRVMSASIHLHGNAAHWYQAYKMTEDDTGWARFSAAIRQEFDTNVHRDCMRELMMLKQVSTVQEYKIQFTQLVYQIQLYDGTMSETLLVTRFILGLREDIRSAVEMQIPQTVQRAAEYALVQEAILERTKVNGAKYSKPYVSKSIQQRVEAAPKQQFAAGHVWRAKQLKEYRRANKLCYGCGEKYAPGHVCSTKQGAQLSAVALTDGGGIIDDAMLDAIAGEEAMDEAAGFLSANAMAGIIANNTVRLRALVGHQVMLLLIDSGSSHTFIDQKLVDRLKCDTHSLPNAMRVKVANGQYISCTSEVRNLEWWVQGTTFKTNMKVLPLGGGYDAILGIDWLAQWGLMQCHWENQWLQFDYHGKSVTLQGIPDTPQTQLHEISVEQLEKQIKGNEIWAMAVVTMMSTHDSSSTPVCVQTLLNNFQDVFHEPKDLPPHRTFDHAISLLPDSVPVNSRPYRYSPQQKDEIERQVAEMIAAGIVLPSMSPFASPVLLVKKKDGTWRFCVDYRRLNALTVKSKFPMLVVDELLDELAGTQWFSKLDLRAGYHQIRMVEADEAKTAFKTHHGQFQFRVMPFGLTNAPATFQCLMNSVFAPHIRKFVLVFMDEILVYSKTLEEHLLHLQQVFSLLRQHQLYAKMSKCSFAQQSLDYLGHIISNKGVETEPDKTSAMAAWPVPTSVTELR